MRSPQYKLDAPEKSHSTSKKNKSKRSNLFHAMTEEILNNADYTLANTVDNLMDMDDGERETHLCYPRKIDQIIKNAIFIAQHIDNADEYKSVSDEQTCTNEFMNVLQEPRRLEVCIHGFGQVSLCASMRECGIS